MGYYITDEQLERLEMVHLLLAREIRNNPISDRQSYKFICSHCECEVSTTDSRSFAEKLCVDCEIKRNKKLCEK